LLDAGRVRAGKPHEHLRFSRENPLVGILPLRWKINIEDWRSTRAQHKIIANRHSQKAGASPKKPEQQQKTNKKESKCNECFATVENSYYEVSQHEKFQFNIHSLKHGLNRDLWNQK
jgi:hypothetical protein